MRCSAPCRATLAMLVIGCTLTACGSADKHIKSLANPSAVSANAGVASYRAALRAAIGALGSDTGKYIDACVQPATQSVGRCMQWASSDEQLIDRQVLEPISRAQVPAALARADKRLHQIINQIYAADIAIARTIAADKGQSRAVHAAIWRVGSAPDHLQGVLDRLDPGLTSVHMQIKKSEGGQR